MSFVRIGIHPNLSGFVIWPGTSSQPHSGQHTTVLTRHALPRDRTSKNSSSGAVIPTRTAGPSLGNRKDTRAHAPGVSTLFQIAPSPAPFVRPPLFLRLPTRCTRSGHHRGEYRDPQTRCNFPCPACRKLQRHPGLTSWAWAPFTRPIGYQLRRTIHLRTIYLRP